MAGFRCPYCSMQIALNDGTTITRRQISFESNHGYESDFTRSQTSSSCVKITFIRCPNCEKYTIFSQGIGSAVLDANVNILPFSQAKQFPSYIPTAIRNDYQEASDIAGLSPKASATLARRCLQGMIRDFWGISKPRLVDEINALKELIPAQQWQVIDGVRRIGNIGAHMEKDINTIVDIEPDEADKLIKLIELLMEQWYINRHEQEQLYSDIIGIDETKQVNRKKTE